jgi:hypothetical protein
LSKGERNRNDGQQHRRQGDRYHRREQRPGEAAAHLLSAEGATLVLGARRVERIRALAEELQARGGKALAQATDVTQPGQVKSLVDSAVQTYGRVAGVDIEAKHQIHERIRVAANHGVTVIVLSSDLAETIALCDTVHTMYAGQLVASYANPGPHDQPHIISDVLGQPGGAPANGSLSAPDSRSSL